MSTIFNRRAALRVFGVGSAALATSAASSAASVAENPELIELGAKWDEAFTAFETAAASFANSHGEYLAVRLAIPDVLFASADESLYLGLGSLTDYDGRLLQHPTRGFRRILTVGTIEANISDFSGRTKIGKRLRRALPVAEEYENTIWEIFERSKIEEFEGRCNQSVHELERIGEQISSFPALSGAGKQIKIRAILQFINVKSPGPFYEGYRAKDWALDFVKSLQS